MLTLLLFCSASSICASHIPISPVPRAFILPKPAVPTKTTFSDSRHAYGPESEAEVKHTRYARFTKWTDDSSAKTSARPPVPTTSQMSWREWLNATSTYSVPETRNSGLVTGDGPRILTTSRLMSSLALSKEVKVLTQNRVSPHWSLR